MLPHFANASDGPMNDIERRMLDSEAAIERWFRQQWQERTAPIYSSVDVRRARFKLAPVDTNLFPGGWNNLPPRMLTLAAQAARQRVGEHLPRPSRLLLVPENHTRNLHYLSNVAHLQRLFEQAGLQVRLGTLNPEIQQATDLALPDGSHLTLEPLLRQRGRLGVAGFDPELILLNNDLSAGAPGLLQNLQGQCLLPPLHAGWHVRSKTQHFKAYDNMATGLAAQLGIDPWWINPMFSACEGVDFAQGVGMNRLQAQVDALLARIQRKYAEYGLTDKPYVVVKADHGTYGMGIMMVHDASELSSLSRRSRNKMAVIKDGQAVSNVILQEGIPTCEQVEGAAAETVVYMVDRHVVGSFRRVHPERGAEDNLNTPGARFVPLEWMAQAALTPPAEIYPCAVLARLAALAASHELEAPSIPVLADGVCA